MFIHFLIHLWNVHFYKLHHSFGHMCTYITVMLLKDRVGIEIVLHTHLSKVFRVLSIITKNGFGGLEVACWPLVPKFPGVHLAEAFGFLGRKNPQHAFRQRGSKAIGPMS